MRRLLGRGSRGRILDRDLYFYVVSYPRSGTTWMVNSCLDYFGAQRSELNSTIYRAGKVFLAPGLAADLQSNYDEARPVQVKTHMTRDMFVEAGYPENKTIYMIRDGRDVLLSYYFYTYGFLGRQTDIVNTFNGEHFREFLVKEGPRYAEHVRGWSRVKHVCIVPYEELHAEYEKVLETLAKYLDRKPVKSAGEVTEKYAKHFRDRFKGDNMSFFRKGEVGDWKNYFDSETEAVYWDSVGGQAEGAELMRKVANVWRNLI